MTILGRAYKVDWGHVSVLAAIAGSTIWYLLDTRSVSLKLNNLLLVEPLCLVAVVLCLIILPQCFTLVATDDGRPADSKREATDPMTPTLPTGRAEVVRMLGFAALLGVFVFSLTVVGFDIAIFVFCMLGMVICGERRPLPLILFPLVVTAITIYGFRALMPYPMVTSLI